MADLSKCDLTKMEEPSAAEQARQDHDSETPCAVCGGVMSVGLAKTIGVCRPCIADAFVQLADEGDPV